MFYFLLSENNAISILQPSVNFIAYILHCFRFPAVENGEDTHTHTHTHTHIHTHTHMHTHTGTHTLYLRLSLSLSLSLSLWYYISLKLYRTALKNNSPTFTLCMQSILNTCTSTCLRTSNQKLFCLIYLPCMKKCDLCIVCYSIRLLVEDVKETFQITNIPMEL